MEEPTSSSPLVQKPNLGELRSYKIIIWSLLSISAIFLICGFVLLQTNQVQSKLLQSQILWNVDTGLA